MTTASKRRSGVTCYGEALRQKTEARVIAALRRHGPLSLSELAKRLRMADSTAWLTIKHLRAAGLVCQLTEKRRTGKHGALSALYALSRDGLAMPTPPASQIAQPRDAHPVALVVAEWVKAEQQSQVTL